MNIPPYIKIEGIIHEIYRIPIADDGETIYNPAVVNINSRQSQDKQELALVHEIFEIINEAHELKLPHNKIMTLGSVIHQVLKDNPELFL